MHEKINKIKEMSEIKECLTKWVKEETDKGKDACCCSPGEVEIMGEVVDMIKDLAEAEEKCWKACYYKSIVEAMDEYGEQGKREGYDNWRYASGRFAPTGRGSYEGFHPGKIMMDEPEWDMMGYTKSGGGNRSQSGNSMGYSDQVNSGGRSGYTPTSDYYERPYDRYQDARRHYTETGSPNDKKEMEQHADEHMRESMESIKEIWRDADPQMKSRLKSEMSKAMNEMK